MMRGVVGNARARPQCATGQYTSLAPENQNVKKYDIPLVATDRRLRVTRCGPFSSSSLVCKDNI